MHVNCIIINEREGNVVCKIGNNAFGIICRSYSKLECNLPLLLFAYVFSSPSTVNPTRSSTFISYLCDILSLIQITRHSYVIYGLNIKFTWIYKFCALLYFCSEFQYGIMRTFEVSSTNFKL